MRRQRKQACSHLDWCTGLSRPPPPIPSTTLTVAECLVEKVSWWSCMRCMPAVRKTTQRWRQQQNSEAYLHDHASKCARSELWRQDSSVQLNQNENVEAVCLHGASERLDKTKQMRPGLPILSLYRLLQRFSMHQTKQRDYQKLADAYYNTYFSAVETRLDYIPANMVSYTTVWRQTTISN